MVTSADEAESRAKRGEDVILATATTCPDDVHGMIAARAVVTEFGGSTSHAAVVGRSLGLPLRGRLRRRGGDGAQWRDGYRRRPERGASIPAFWKSTTPTSAKTNGLRQLLHWVAERSPLRVLRPDEAPEEDILDLDALEAAADPDGLAELLQGVEAAGGRTVSSDEGIAARPRGEPALHRRKTYAASAAGCRTDVGRGRRVEVMFADNGRQVTRACSLWLFSGRANVFPSSIH